MSDLTALTTIYAQDATFLVNAVLFFAEIPYFVAALSVKRRCTAPFPVNAAMLHKVVLYAEDLVHESRF